MTLEHVIRDLLKDVVREVVREELVSKKEPTERDLATYEDAAHQASVSVSTIKRWVRTGKLKAFGKGKLRRVRHADVRACLERDDDSVDANAAPDIKASVTSILASVRR